MSTTELEHRITAVECWLAHLTNKVDASPTSQNVNSWIDQIHGTFQNDASYRTAARLGRQWRKSHRPGNVRAKTATSK